MPASVPFWTLRKGTAGMFALFKDGKQISKAHTKGIAAVTEAFERKAVVRCSSDFDGQTFAADLSLADGYEIREVFEIGK